MRTTKRILLGGAILLALLSMSGCMVISCEEHRPPKPRRFGRPPHCQVIDQVRVALLSRVPNGGVSHHLAV